MSLPESFEHSEGYAIDWQARFFQEQNARMIAERNARIAEREATERALMSSEESDIRAKKQIQRCSFIWAIEDCKIIGRKSLMEVIEILDLGAENIEYPREVPSTEIIVQNKCPSVNSKAKDVNMSNFHRKILANRSTLAVKHLIMSGDTMLEIILRKWDLSEDAFNIILNKEIKILESIRCVIYWYRLDPTFNEKCLQKIFILFVTGLFSNIGNLFKLSPINNLKLETMIDVILDSKPHKMISVSLNAYSDVALYPSRINSDPLDSNHLLDTEVVIGELKVSKAVPSINKGVNQTLAELYALVQMRSVFKSAQKKRKLGESCPQILHKAFLSDMFNIRMIICSQIDATTSTEYKYSISSLYNTSREFILCILLLTVNIAAGDLPEIVDLTPDEVKEIDDEATEFKEGANNEEEDNEGGGRATAAAELFKGKGRNVSQEKMRKKNAATVLGERDANIPIMLMGEDSVDEEHEDLVRSMNKFAAACRGEKYLNAENLALATAKENKVPY